MSTNNMGPNGRRLMHALPTANNATLRCDKVYRAAQAHGITFGRLSPWDQAFLHGFYTTSQSSVLEVTTINHRMFEQIVGR